MLFKYLIHNLTKNKKGWTLVKESNYSVRHDLHHSRNLSLLNGKKFLQGFPGIFHTVKVWRSQNHERKSNHMVAFCGQS